MRRAPRATGGQPLTLADKLQVLAQPGIGIKRWILLFAIGFGCLALGVALAISVPLSSRLMDILRAVTLKPLPSYLRAGIFVGFGLLFLSIGAYRLYRVAVRGMTVGNHNVALVDNLVRQHMQRVGPRVVAIGGGTGLSTLLRGLRVYPGEITAIVTVADDGGSSGRLRRDLNIPPPGDARSCLVALSEAEPLLAELFAFRFAKGEGLEGHNLGNLFLAALTEIRSGDFQEALDSAAVLLNLRGWVVASSPSRDLVLNARTSSGRVLLGESAVGHAGAPIQDVWLLPQDASASDYALHAIADADIIVIGPGSLYTSILPNFLIRDIAKAVEQSTVPKVFVCNVATQEGETDDFDALRHLEVFKRYSGVSPTHLVVNTNPFAIDPSFGQRPVVAPDALRLPDVKVVARDLIDASMPSRHDPAKLAQTIVEIAWGAGERRVRERHRVARTVPIVERPSSEASHAKVVEESKVPAGSRGSAER